MRTNVSACVAPSAPRKHLSLFPPGVRPPLRSLDCACRSSLQFLPLYFELLNWLDNYRIMTYTPPDSNASKRAGGQLDVKHYRAISR